jgi:acetyl-CoA acetyltransferase
MDVAIIGIGIHPFGRFEGMSGLDLGEVALRRALSDATLDWNDVQFAFGGSIDGGYADSLVSRMGLSGIPFTNVSNGCATGGSALALAVDRIRSGESDLGVAVGFDKHPRGAFAADPAVLGLPSWYGDTGLMITTQFFAMKIQRYMHIHGISESSLLKVAAKAFRNGSMNPNAWRQKPISEAEIGSSRRLNHPLTQYMLCSPNEGAAAVVLCRADRARNYTEHPIIVRGVALRTRLFGSFEVMAPSLPLEQAPAPTAQAATACYEMAGIGPEDVDVAQLQDGEVGAEIMHMAENGLCRDGEQEALIQAGETDIGGRLPINTDGGLLANGEPIGASALRQIHELVLQLRGDAGTRQVPGEPRVGYAQVYGAPGTGCCTILSR